jgi:diamine N-acetyltransferase
MSELTTGLAAEPPMVELLSWLSSRTRTYDEAIEAWHSHCPRLTVWEDALIDGLIRIERDNGNSTVALTQRGRATLVRAERAVPEATLEQRVRLGEITEANRDAVLALRVAPGQQRFVGSVKRALEDAAEYPRANPWYRAVYADGEPVGFVMLSWNVEPQPPEIIGPWFLWKLLIDERYQGRGYGTEVVRQVAELVRAEGATELLTSYVEGPGGPRRFYERLGFKPTGERDDKGEVIVRLPLTTA